MKLFIPHSIYFCGMQRYYYKNGHTYKTTHRKISEKEARDMYILLNFENGSVKEHTMAKVFGKTVKDILNEREIGDDEL